MRLPKIIFVVAGIYGLVALIPNYFLEDYVGASDPPAITHPEYFYGFVGVALAWQILFFIIASDPRRYRPVMPVAFLEKLGFGAAAVVLFIVHRVQTQIFVFGLIDLLFGALFLYAYKVTPKTPAISLQ